MPNCLICVQPVLGGLQYKEGSLHLVCRDNAYQWLHQNQLHRRSLWQIIRQAIEEFNYA